MFTFLLIVQFIIAALLVGVILVQKSEGGGLTTGGSPGGLMSARGAADFLTRSTAILATAFILMSIVLAFLASTRQSSAIDPTLQRKAAPAAAITAPAPAAAPTQAPAAPEGAAPAGNSQVPFSQ
jgi:preprotein translocase subunit SecG